MQASIAGMNAQATRLATVGDNITNATTVGYKRSESVFSSMVLPATGGSFNAGGVTSNVRYSISDQGSLSYTTSTTDLSVQGAGFFVVKDAADTAFLTRAGGFVPTSDGYLTNSAGYRLTGVPYVDGVAPIVPAGGYDTIEPINLKANGNDLMATPSTTGRLNGNLDADATVVASGTTPAQNIASSTYSHKTAMIAYDNLGRSFMMDIYYTKTADNTWEVAVFSNEDAGADGFPYSSGPITTTTLDFSPLNGKAINAPIIDIPIPGGATLQLDLFGTTQLADTFVINQGTVNGSAVAKVTDYQVSANGVLSAIYNNGEQKALYQLALAAVESPNNLSVISGTVYQRSDSSGQITLGNPNSLGLGSIFSGALENSNVDIANELSELIESQKMYTANSKVFQTSADLLETIANLKR